VILAIEQVRFAFGQAEVLRGVSLELAAGEAVALLGPNGAGKTTLTKLVIALLHPSSGKVSLDGMSTAGKSPEDMARHVGYVFQHPDQQLFARTVVDEVAFGPRQLGVGAGEARDRAVEALCAVGLDGMADTHPYDLSPADRKLVTVAAALAQHPRVLVLDEPTHGLDRAAAGLVSRVVRTVASAGTAVLGVSHDLTFVAETFYRAVVLRDGQTRRDEPVDRLLCDEAGAVELGLVPPPAASVSVALDLPGRPVTVEGVARAISNRRATR
jgi:energy-coupling factor transport system ATP-binding protein